MSIPNVILLAALLSPQIHYTFICTDIFVDPIPFLSNISYVYRNIHTSNIVRETVVRTVPERV